MRRYTPAGADINSVIDVRAVFQQGHRELDLEAMPQFLLPAKGPIRAARLREDLLPGPAKRQADIFDMRGIDRERGCMVVVRPDQYVAACAAARCPRRAGGVFSIGSCSRRGDLILRHLTEAAHARRRISFTLRLSRCCEMCMRTE